MMIQPKQNERRKSAVAMNSSNHHRIRPKKAVKCPKLPPSLPPSSPSSPRHKCPSTFHYTPLESTPKNTHHPMRPIFKPPKRSYFASRTETEPHPSPQAHPSSLTPSDDHRKGNSRKTRLKISLLRYKFTNRKRSLSKCAESLA
jgi:hypothetical protein